MAANLGVLVADHMLIITKSGRASGTNVVDGETTQHVSMAAANSVSLSVCVHAFSGTDPDTLEVLLEESNDRSNWFAVVQTTGAAIKLSDVGATKAFTYDNTVGMGWVRVLFLLNDTSAPSHNSTVSCTLSTTLK